MAAKEETPRPPTRPGVAANYRAGLYNPFLRRMRETFDRAGIKHQIPIKLPGEVS